MGRIDNINGDEIADLLRRVRALENRTTLNNSAIGRGGMEVYDGGVLNISNGGLVVNGSAQIVGTLNADGTINMTGLFIASGTMQLNGTTIATGDFNIDGPLIVDGNTTFNGTLNINGITTIQGDTTVTGKLITNGPVDINGLTKITGSLEITGTGNLTVSGTMNINGASTLNNDLTVAAGKRIILGGLTLENTGAGGGTMNFPNGSVSSGTFGMLLASSVEIELSAPSVQLNGIGTVSSVTANIYMDGSGQLKRII